MLAVIRFLNFKNKELVKIIVPLIALFLQCCVPYYYTNVSTRLKVKHNYYIRETNSIINTIEIQVDCYENADLKIDSIAKNYSAQKIIEYYLKIIKGSKYVFVFRGPFRQVYLNGDLKKYIISFALDKSEINDTLLLLSSDNSKIFFYYGQTTPEFLVEFSDELQGSFIIYRREKNILEGNFDFTGKTLRYESGKIELGWVAGQIAGFRAIKRKFKSQPEIIMRLPLSAGKL